MTSSSLTWFFKEIFPKYDDFEYFMTDYNIVDMTVPTNQTFARYVYKILFRRYHNSNIQFDTVEDFKCELANILEDNFTKYQKQIELVEAAHKLTPDDMATINTALTNSAANPNTEVDDPTKPLQYISSQAFTMAQENKLQAYLRAIQSLPSKMVDSLLLRVVNLFKTVLSNQIYIYGGEIKNGINE